jgi:hypothetical protein
MDKDVGQMLVFVPKDFVALVLDFVVTLICLLSGNGEPWCGRGCRTGFGECGASAITTRTTITTTTTTRPITSLPTNALGGSCGPNVGFCGDGSCCSQYGWCGNQADWCGTGCQPAFGKCGLNFISTSTAVPAPSTAPGQPQQPQPPVTLPPTTNIGKRFFHPYVDVLLWPTLDAAAVATTTGIRWFTLAFIVDDGRGNPSWGGVVALDQQWYMPYVNQLRAMGGDVSNPY